jgi:hypothetical protein
LGQRNEPQTSPRRAQRPSRAKPTCQPPNSGTISCAEFHPEQSPSPRPVAYRSSRLSSPQLAGSATFRPIVPAAIAHALSACAAALAFRVRPTPEGPRAMDFRQAAVAPEGVRARRALRTASTGLSEILLRRPRTTVMDDWPSGDARSNGGSLPNRSATPKALYAACARRAAGGHSGDSQRESPELRGPLPRLQTLGSPSGKAAHPRQGDALPPYQLERSVACSRGRGMARVRITDSRPLEEPTDLRQRNNWHHAPSPLRPKSREEVGSQEIPQVTATTRAKVSLRCSARGSPMPLRRRTLIPT